MTQNAFVTYLCRMFVVQIGIYIYIYLRKQSVSCCLLPYLFVYMSGNKFLPTVTVAKCVAIKAIDIIPNRQRNIGF